MGEEIREFACCVTVVSAATIRLSERYAGAGQRLDQAEMNGLEPSLWSSWFPVGLTRAMSVKRFAKTYQHLPGGTFILSAMTF